MSLLKNEPIRAPSEVTLLDDRFDTGLDGWSYWEEWASYSENHSPSSSYRLQWVSNTAQISGDGYGVFAGMQKVVDLSTWDESGVLLLSFDWKATSGTSASGCTNANLWIHDADSSSILYSQSLLWGETTDTGWRNYVDDVSSYVRGHSRIRIILYLGDGWNTNWQQTNSYDNVRLTSAASA